MPNIDAAAQGEDCYIEVGPRRGQYRQRSPAEPRQIAPHQQRLGFLVVAVGGATIALDEVVADRVELDFLGVLVRRHQRCQIGEYPAGGRLPPHLLEPPPAVPGARDEGRDRREERQHRDPGRERDQHRQQRPERDHGPRQVEDLSDHLDRAVSRFALRLLELIVVGGVLEVSQVQRVGVSHHQQLDVDRELLLKQLLTDVPDRLEEARPDQESELKRG
ncbi:MAG: hypothetical protein M3Q71_15830 [Chloroflexota bacterium]|nr:hypothetical protein [Chloroflexota bacterium]